MNHSAEKREMILEKASTLFSQKGYFGVGINEIISACDIPKGSFYHYFPGGKNQLAVAVVHDAYDKMEMGIRKNIFSVSDNAVEVFCWMAECLARDIENGREGLKSLIITFMGIEATYISEELDEASKEVYRKWEVLYREKLMACGYDEMHADQYSKMLLTLIHGNLISCWISKDSTNLRNIKNLLPNLLPDEN